MNLILLKLGGSALTAKSAGRKKINARVLRQTSKTLAKFIHKNPSWKILLVHGAGPFGHQTVLEYGIRNGVRSARHREGFAKTHSEMLRLNSLVMEFLLREGTSAISFSPLELLTQHNKKIRSFNTVPIENALKPGLVPVLFGDFVFDSKLGGSVVSGDAILAHLAQKLKPKRILLGGNFEGVLDSAGKPIPLITARNFSSALRSVHAPQGADVTGGMKGKLRELRKIKGIPITLFDLRSASALKWALEGKKTGTALHF